MRIDRHPNGPRLYIGRVRVHHFSSGALLVLVSYRGRRRRRALAACAAALGLAAMLHDRRDWRAALLFRD